MKKNRSLISICCTVLVVLGISVVISPFAYKGFIWLTTYGAPMLYFGGDTQAAFFLREKTRDITDDERESYLRRKQKDLESTMIEDVYFLINGIELAVLDDKGTYKDSARIWLYAYSFSPIEDEVYTINSISLVLEDGQVLCEKNDCNLFIKTQTPTGDIHKESIELCTFSVEEDWYHIGTKLVLNVEIEKAGNVENLSFDIEVGEYRIPKITV